jgi:hypothetical protein
MTLPRLATALLLAVAASGCAARPPPAPAPAPAPAAKGPGPTTRASFSGCLAATSEADAANHPAPPVTRSAPAPTAKIVAVAGGVSVEHPVTHACCLTAAVTTRLEGRTAVVNERLSGSPCRCRCGSTIRTEVSLAPGEWTVAVELEDSSGTRRVAEQAVKVP